ncbi:KilA-N domain-containing protein [Rubrivivax gelatinosus]|uniref:KilA domain-containing protein n=1 Tax=Rubrivivax gelatinosus TaxID=28068 RepID=A0A4V2SHM9_RUBGE|nr:KilA-N domain-containing protein [Rubrivivax gelatinosus]MBK1686183.1 hypothetical protein [Rubrivivax gelatinosus]TCP05678.1 KilA domain-containing protein [Rubrivivax gelatinosus]
MAPLPARATPFILEDTYVRQDEQGRYSLNDLHVAAGGQPRHQPSNWLRTAQAQELAAAASNSSDSRNCPSISSVQQRGTFVVRDLVYAYAMWISPEFHLKVIRTFDAVVTGRLSPAAEPVGAVSGLPAAKLISLQNQSWSLIQRLRAERDPELRRALYAQLAVVMGDLGQAAPALENIGRDAPAVPAVVADFWKVYVQLEAKGVRLNHHRNPSLIAVNLRHFVKAAAEHKLRAPLAQALRDSLRLSRAPRFVDARNVKSGLLGTAIFCWVFEAEPEGGAQ